MDRQSFFLSYFVYAQCSLFTVHMMKNLNDVIILTFIHLFDGYSFRTNNKLKVTCEQWAVSNERRWSWENHHHSQHRQIYFAAQKHKTIPFDRQHNESCKGIKEHTYIQNLYRYTSNGWKGAPDKMETPTSNTSTSTRAFSFKILIITCRCCHRHSSTKRENLTFWVIQNTVHRAHSKVPIRKLCYFDVIQRECAGKCVGCKNTSDTGQHSLLLNIEHDLSRFGFYFLMYLMLIMELWGAAQYLVS